LLGTKIKKLLVDAQNKHRSNYNKKIFEKIHHVVNLVNPDETPEIIRRPLSSLNTIYYETNNELLKKLEKSIHKIKSGVSNKKTVLTKINMNNSNLNKQSNNSKAPSKTLYNDDSDDDIYKNVKDVKKVKQPEKPEIKIPLKLVSEEEKEDVLKYKNIDIFTLLGQSKK